MSDLEKFIHNDQIHVPHLLKIALIHINSKPSTHSWTATAGWDDCSLSSTLVSFGLLHKPALYLSDFFERHRGEYYDHLMAVRTTHKLEPWVRFFLLGMRETPRCPFKCSRTSWR